MRFEASYTFPLFLLYMIAFAAQCMAPTNFCVCPFSANVCLAKCQGSCDKTLHTLISEKAAYCVVMPRGHCLVITFAMALELTLFICQLTKCVALCHTYPPYAWNKTQLPVHTVCSHIQSRYNIDSYWALRNVWLVWRWVRIPPPLPFES
jgi:hypothetical protein